jgi:Transposase DDE domain
MNESKRAGGELEVIEKVAELAMKLGQRHLAEYGANTSRHDFTQWQLMSCLILRAYLKNTYRGVLELLAVSPPLRERLGMTEKLPHFTTLQKFSARSQVLAVAQKLVAEIGQAAAAQAPTQPAAMDATGMALTTASDYFRTRKGGKVRKWVKVSVMVLCGSLLPLGVMVELGAVNDKLHARSLLAQAQAVAQPPRLYADAGYDSEPLHVQCREQWGVESVINPVQRRADGLRGGRWRALMSPEYLQASNYGQRWAVESFFSGLKRTTGGALQARRPEQMVAEATFRVLAYVLRR